MYFIVRTSNVIRFLRLRAQNKAKFSRIRLLYIHLILKPVERPVSVLTGFDRFFGGFLNFKISKRPRPLCLRPRKDRDHGPVLIRFSPVRSPVFYRSLRPDLETLVIIHTAAWTSQYLSESCLNIEGVVKIDSTGTENGSVTVTISGWSW